MQRILPLILAAFVLACAGPDMHDVGEEGSSVATQESALAYSFCGAPPFGCPAGYTAIAYQCTARCTALGVSCSPFGYNETFCYKPDPATGTISATPTNVRINLDVTTLGSTNVCWSVSNATTGEVWVAAAGLPETLFARAPSGCADAPWFHAGDNMVFRLYEGTAHTNVLASVNVTAEGYHGGTNPPPQCGPCQSGYSCFCGDRVCRREGTLCP
ncbi:hypothetical protein JYJ95_03940 [Corallococcus exiguus]|uniref:hypothetical protein n=1 Tax=Corallococcus exiguus TaxID=83462 RepID=UPI001A9023BD|nr:hypothetical protein [Corallococcus exiguus]MBN8465647.1 hypothetical protein [Corallococcus exiguus]